MLVGKIRIRVVPVVRPVANVDLCVKVNGNLGAIRESLRVGGDGRLDIELASIAAKGARKEADMTFGGGALRDTWLLRKTPRREVGRARGGGHARRRRRRGCASGSPYLKRDVAAGAAYRSDEGVGAANGGYLKESDEEGASPRIQSHACAISAKRRSIESCHPCDPEFSAAISRGFNDIFSSSSNNLAPNIFLFPASGFRRGQLFPSSRMTSRCSLSSPSPCRKLLQQHVFALCF
mmetsp:Transcript_26330/g.77846  ORF Transcript_26330/g.77846 Transcript_26330/m.77846 type:complete len:236 (+) Transcript_26330:1523-2230(+)